MRPEPEAQPGLRVLPPPPLRLVDVALFYGERSGGIRTMLDAKARVLATEPGVEHHVVVPGRGERDAARRELPAVRLAGPNGYRLPLGAGGLRRALADIAPDIVVLHDPFWATRGVIDSLRDDLGAHVVVAHHGSVKLDAAGLPGPDGLWRPVLRGWMRRAYRGVDAVMAAADPLGDTDRAAALPLRFGVDPAFAPQPGVARGDHVLYAGRLAREKGVDTLLQAAALSREPWPLRIVGSGPRLPELRSLARRLGLAERVSFEPFEPDRAALARAYRRARAVVMPGPHETFGLVALEAAASGARVVCADGAPVLGHLNHLAHRFVPGDAADLLHAITAARATPRDLAAAARLSSASTWESAVRAELADLRALAGHPAARELRVDRRPRRRSA